MDNVVLVGRESIEVSEREMLMLATIDPLLKKLRLSLYCPKCWALGTSDGAIRGNNHLNDKSWTIECACSVRRSLNPARNPVTVA
ncbi:MAG TPA: hypothetical protein VEA16_10955 [Vicinamibacterales bacterium]|nr:hypothetical protein [Vicinamibacterales bacterium]